MNDKFKNLESQLCTVEQAKRLKELGAPQNSFWYWTERWMPHQKDDWLLDYNKHGNQFAAFSVAELGQLLPWDIVIARDYKSNWIATFQADGLPENCTASFKSESEVEVRFKLLEFLLNHKLLVL